jgi:hypothetical protein
MDVLKAIKISDLLRNDGNVKTMGNLSDILRYHLTQEKYDCIKMTLKTSLNFVKKTASRRRYQRIRISKNL